MCSPLLLDDTNISHSYDTGTIGGIIVMPYWKKQFSTGYTDAQGPNITTSQESAIVSILSAGTFFGALASPLLADYLGRRPGLIISTWVFNLGVVLQTASTAIPMFLAGRFFAGFGVGLISALSMSCAHQTLSRRLANFWLQSLCISLRQLPNGFVVPLSVPTSLPSRSVYCSRPSSTMRRPIATIVEATESRLPSNLRGP